MKAFKELYLANLREFSRDRTALFFTIAFPILFMLMFGVIFSRPNRIYARVGIAVEDQGTVAQQMATMLEGLPLVQPVEEEGDNPFSELAIERGSRA